METQRGRREAFAPATGSRIWGGRPHDRNVEQYDGDVKAFVESIMGPNNSFCDFRISCQTGVIRTFIGREAASSIRGQARPESNPDVKRESRILRRPAGRHNEAPILDHRSDFINFTNDYLTSASGISYHVLMIVLPTANTHASFIPFPYRIPSSIRVYGIAYHVFRELLG
jgi:hypothetical protein